MTHEALNPLLRESLRPLSRMEQVMLGGQCVLVNTSLLPWTRAENGDFHPPQSWANSPHSITEGIGLRVNAGEGYWEMGIFTFHEKTPPRVTDFDLMAWDSRSFGRADDYADRFNGKLNLVNYSESTSLFISKPGQQGAREVGAQGPTYNGIDIAIEAHGVNAWERSPTVSEGKLRVYPSQNRPVTEPFRTFTTRLAVGADQLLSLVEQLSRDRFCDNDRALLWKATEERITALAEAKVAREARLADFPERARTSGLAGAVGSLLRRILP